MFKNAFTVVFSLVLAAATIFGLSYGSYELYAYFNPKYEQVRYDTFKNSQAYNEGMVRHLYEIQRQYNAGSDSDKDSLRLMVIHEFEVYDINRLPFDLQTFYRSLNK